MLVLVICPASSLLGRRFRARERSLLSKIEEQDSTIAHLKTVELTLLDQLRQQRLRAHEAHKGMRELRAHTHRNLATRAEIEANATARVEAAEKSLEDRIAAALEFERSKTEQARAEPPPPPPRRASRRPRRRWPRCTTSWPQRMARVSTRARWPRACAPTCWPRPSKPSSHRRRAAAATGQDQHDYQQQQTQLTVGADLFLAGGAAGLEGAF